MYAGASSITATAAVSISIKYTERLAEAGIEPSVGSVGDSYDKLGRDGHRPLQDGSDPSERTVATFEAVEFATLEWVDWFNNRRLWTDRQHAAGRIRGALLRHTGKPSYGGVTQTKRPPANPGRFKATDCHNQIASCVASLLGLLCTPLCCASQPVIIDTLPHHKSPRYTSALVGQRNSHNIDVSATH